MTAETCNVITANGEDLMENEKLNHLMTFPVFRNLTGQEIADIHGCGLMRSKKYKKGDIILTMGAYTDRLGVVLNGSVTIENIDLWGNRSILSDVAAGRVFGETYALTGEMLMVDAVAASDCEILFLDVKKMTGPAYRDRSWFPVMLMNLLMLSSRKNLTLSNRIFHTSSKRVRSRLQSYLSFCSMQAGSEEFDIPFDRQQLADYLNLDRTAMSKELGRMRDEGILEFRKKHFVLYKL